MNTNLLGILGGLGPMSGIYFCEMLTEHTQADRDQDHLNFILSSRATTPDRTDYILGRSSSAPLPAMLTEVQRLIRAGANLIAIPCNTAHYFYESIAQASSVPVINIIEQTVAFCRFCGFHRVGILATEGTIASGAYELVLQQANIDCRIPTPDDQMHISRMIYDQIKRGIAPDANTFYRIANHLLDQGCDTVILGCTELSLLKRDLKLGTDFTDSLEVLACAAIQLCQKKPVGFDAALLNFTPVKGQNHVAE